jgi:UDP-N-acetylmuramate dehydrogenase
VQPLIEINQNIPLTPLTTLGIGGNARFFVEVYTTENLKQAIISANEKKLPWIVIGGGSNLLVSDKGYPGLVIKNNLQGITFEQEKIKIQAGTSLQELVDFTIENELDGMSTMTGIPGSVGGAIYGSAGAYGDNIRDFLLEISYLDGEEIKTLTKDQFETGYRDSFFKHHKSLVILSAVFGGFQKGNKEEMQKECEQIMQKRNAKYPPEQKCPGSFFKNVIASELSNEQLKNIPPDKIIFGKIPAGYLLESVGAKGAKRGQIAVAENHANTFINLGEGSAEDFYQLSLDLAKKVYQKFSIKLEPEVQFINLAPFIIG